MLVVTSACLVRARRSVGRAIRYSVGTLRWEMVGKVLLILVVVYTCTRVSTDTWVGVRDFGPGVTY